MSREQSSFFIWSSGALPIKTNSFFSMKGVHKATTPQAMTQEILIFTCLSLFYSELTVLKDIFKILLV